MTHRHGVGRREFLQMGAAAGMVAGLGRFSTLSAATDYKALVCVFLAGGNDGHNMVVPLGGPEYAAYQTARGGLALSASQLPPIGDPVQGAFGFHYAMPELAGIYNAGDLAVVSNVGVLVQPTLFHDLNNPAFPLPSQLRSHSDQVAEVQSGFQNPGAPSGWGGRLLDAVQAQNASTSFPVSIAMNSPALFCAGGTVSGVNLRPGNALDQNALGIYPPEAAAARLAALQQIVGTDAGNTLVNAANATMGTAITLNPLLRQAQKKVTFQKAFPQSGLGKQLEEVARIINLRNQLGVGRQVFFCTLGGFDTHAGQDYQQMALLIELSQALEAFYLATSQLGVLNDVTTFTLSDFGRTLQPSGTGSDHGWGNHQLVMGGAVQGARIYGRFPKATNYANLNATADDYADNRGTLLPNIGLSQYGATLASWFGADDGQLEGICPGLKDFSPRNLGFLG